MNSTATGEKLRHVLRSIMDETGVEGMIVFTMDGFPVASEIRATGEMLEELFSAIGAGLASLAENTLKNIGMLPLSRLTIESPRGNILLEKANQEIGIMALAGPSIPLGIMRVAIQKASTEIDRILGREQT